MLKLWWGGSQFAGNVIGLGEVAEPEAKLNY
jgi:hypothetical protein